MLLVPDQDPHNPAAIHPGDPRGRMWSWTEADWLSSSYLFLQGRRLWCSSLFARSPGNGAFRRLLNGAEADGLEVVVPCPLLPMMAVLQHYGFVRTPAENENEDWVDVWGRRKVQ